jgi:hypothetical protein
VLLNRTAVIKQIQSHCPPDVLTNPSGIDVVTHMHLMEDRAMALAGPTQKPVRLGWMVVRLAVVMVVRALHAEDSVKLLLG